MANCVRGDNTVQWISIHIKQWGAIGVVMGLLMVLGCVGSQYHLLFTQVDGLKEGAPLIFEKNRIGTVQKVSYTKEGRYRVSVSVETDFAAAMTEFSRFEILPSSENTALKTLVMTHEKRGGTLLEKGSTTEAMSPNLLMPFSSVPPMLKQLERGWDQLISDLKKIPQGESFQAFEKKIDDLGQQMRESGSAFQDNVRNNIIPKLQKELETLRKKFEQSGEPDKTKPLEQKLKDLQDV